ncbi:MAG: N-acetylmuramoyl-L-alanine amidase [Rhodospirillaceae bacterium TMED8]|nr:N-acetylmuramoyl-L-alanine amidase [Magnetovibrio sp.]OUT52291.1 MAG: N-acetylmuramoyl-L-alanine amidase [Rhodospirillaceae bacterium TMED8]
MIEAPSPNFGPRPDNARIDILVLHYTGMPSREAALERLCSSKSEVSAHYLIDEMGEVYRLVDEGRRAWHAGIAYWRGAVDINSRSIGVELVNPGHEYGYSAFPIAQYAALQNLALNILSRYPIPARNVVGHSDIAPGRKTDPGEFFDWQAMAGIGVGLWPMQSNHLELDIGRLKTLLGEIGYDVNNLAAAFRAFQRHFRPTRVNGRMDSETARLILGLHEQVGGNSPLSV